eukprot:646953-Rhodomonas_salina.4
MTTRRRHPKVQRSARAQIMIACVCVLLLPGRSIVENLAKRFQLRPAGGSITLDSCVFTFGNCAAGSGVAWEDAKQVDGAG